MNQFTTRLYAQFQKYFTSCSNEESASILELLWYCYSASNPTDDGLIKKSEASLDIILEELPISHKDTLWNSVVALCTAYQRAAFLEGIRLGFLLSNELEKSLENSPPPSP